MDINARIAKIADNRTRELVELRRQLHQQPELAFEEHETAKAVGAFLGKLGVKYKTGIGKTTEVPAQIIGRARAAHAASVSA